MRTIFSDYDVVFAGICAKQKCVFKRVEYVVGQQNSAE